MRPTCVSVLTGHCYGKVGPLGFLGVDPQLAVGHQLTRRVCRGGGRGLKGGASTGSGWSCVDIGT